MMSLPLRFLPILAALAVQAADPQVRVGTKPIAGSETIIDGMREMIEAKWIYWEGPGSKSSTPIKWRILPGAVDGGTCLMTDDRAADGGKIGTADIVKKKPYRDFWLHIEFLIMNPRGNGGVRRRRVLRVLV